MQNSSTKAVAFLFGAGASARLGYPTVEKFFSRIKGGGGSLDASQHLARYIRVIKQPNTPETWPNVNAEEVFGLAEQMLEVEKALAVDRPGPLKIRDGISAGELYKRLCRELVEIYGGVPAEVPAGSDPLAEALKLASAHMPQAERLWLFTTNYDTVIEDSLRRWANPQEVFNQVQLETGFDPAPSRRFNPDRFGRPPEDGLRSVNVVKLHGSVTWKHETADSSSPIIETGMRAPTDYDCALYFGYKRFPDHEPFATLHRLFKRALLRPLILVTIGFQFGDPYLRELVDFALDANSKLRVICCLRTEPKEGSPVRELMERHEKRFEMLRGDDGNLVPFDEKAFPAALEARLGTSTLG